MFSLYPYLTRCRKLTVPFFLQKRIICGGTTAKSSVIKINYNLTRLLCQNPSIHLPIHLSISPSNGSGIRHIEVFERDNCIIQILTLIVFMCSFLVVVDFPIQRRRNHWIMYHTLLGVGMMLNGGGTVPPSSK